MKVATETTRTLNNMTLHMNAVRTAWSPIDPRLAGECAASLATCLSSILTMGVTDLWRDGILGLGGKTDYGLVFGVVPHREHRDHEFEMSGTDLPHGLYCWHAAERRVHTLPNVRTGEDAPVGVNPCEHGEPVVLPVPIRWSMHS